MRNLLNSRAARVFVAATMPLTMAFGLAGNSIAETLFTPATPVSAVAPNQGLTIDEIAQLLATQGIQAQKSGDGLIFDLPTDGGLTFSIFVSLSGNRQYVWFVTDLVAVDAQHPPSQAELLNLLTANQALGNAHLEISGGYLEMAMEVRNDHPTADELAERLKDLKANLVWSMHLWYLPAGAGATTRP